MTLTFTVNREDPVTVHLKPYGPPLVSHDIGVRAVTGSDKDEFDWLRVFVWRMAYQLMQRVHQQEVVRDRHRKEKDRG